MAAQLCVTTGLVDSDQEDRGSETEKIADVTRRWARRRKKINRSSR
jgi:hypothetical protein